MKKLLIALGVIILSVTSSGVAFAGNYGVAGCGLGALIFEKKNDKVSQILASTTNSIYGNGSFGITSGTSNCDASGLVVASKETEIYAQKNFDSISKEMAAGTGEHLTTLAGLMGYDAAQLAAYGKTHYGQIFASEKTTSSDMLAAIRTGLAA
jgi:hypothetical protein